MHIEKTTDTQSYLDWSDKGQASFWRYGLGAFLALFVFFLISGIGLVPLVMFVPDYDKSLVTSILGKLLSFVMAFFAIPLIVRLIHKRPWWSLMMPRFRFGIRDFLIAFLVSMVVAIVTAGLFSVIDLMPIERNPDFSVETLLLVAPIGFIGVFIQAGSEEFLFRGYLTQFVRRFTANRFLFIGLPALLFALLHIGNIVALGGGMLVMAPYLISGLLYGWAAYRSGSLWMPLGLHLVNNYTGLVMVGTKGDVLPSAAPFLLGVPGLGIVTVAVLAQAAATFLMLSYLMKRMGR